MDIHFFWVTSLDKLSDEVSFFNTLHKKGSQARVSPASCRRHLQSTSSTMALGAWRRGGSLSLTVGGLHFHMFFCVLYGLCPGQKIEAAAAF